MELLRLIAAGESCARTAAHLGLSIKALYQRRFRLVKRLKLAQNGGVPEFARQIGRL